jgi:hypothetical protein
MVEELTAQGGSSRLELQEQPKMISKDMKLTMYQVSGFFDTGTLLPNYRQFASGSGFSLVCSKLPLGWIRIHGRNAGPDPCGKNFAKI